MACSATVLFVLFVLRSVTLPAAAQVYLTKNVRDGYSPGCCKRVYLQPPPLNPFTKLTLCFDTTEEAQHWTDAIQWCQQARQILDSADAAAAAALEVPLPREESKDAQTLARAAIDSMPDLLPDLSNVADLTPPPPHPTAQHAARLQSASPPPPTPPPPRDARAQPTASSQMPPAFVMLDISHLNLPRLSQLQDDA